MKGARALAIFALFLMALSATAVAVAQTAGKRADFDAREQNFRAYMILLRANVKAERREIISDIMRLNTVDATKFWPLFDQYDAELTKIGDARAQLIIDYARSYDHLTNDQADALMTKAFQLEMQRAQLKKKYFDKMKSSLSATQAAKFFLIENQMQHIIDLQISANLPVVQTASK